jgi:hypothetical protein
MSGAQRHDAPASIKRKSSESRRRQKIISVRCYEEEAVQIDANAAAAGFRASGFLRILGTGEQRPHERRRPLPGEAELARLRSEAGHVGGNLAQLLRRVNRGEMVQPDELADAMKAVREFWKKATECLFGA